MVGLARAAVEAHEACGARPAAAAGGHLRGVGVVALERAELHVVDVDVFARCDRPPREADDLAVLQIASPSFTGRTANLCPILIGARQRDGAAVEGEFGAGGDRLAADGDVVLRAKVNGEFGQRRGHGCSSAAGVCGYSSRYQEAGRVGTGTGAGCQSRSVSRRPAVPVADASGSEEPGTGQNHHTSTAKAKSGAMPTPPRTRAFEPVVLAIKPMLG